MRIVIDISEATLAWVSRDTRCLSDEEFREIVYAFQHCIPLPKGYGRLISEKDVLSVILFSKLFDNTKVGEVKEALLNIPTIIEADGCGE